MNLAEKAAYLKGLADGLGLGEATKEEKVLRAVVDLLADVSSKVEDLDGEVDNICEELDMIESDVYDMEEDEDDETAEEDEEPEQQTQYELTCPKCGTVTVVDEDTLMSQEIVCAHCGAPFEIEFGESDEDAAPDAPASDEGDVHF